MFSLSFDPFHLFFHLHFNRFMCIGELLLTSGSIPVLYSTAVQYRPFVAEWLERLAVNAKVAIVLGSIPASSDTVESDGRQIKQC